jgi:hypothetical protein
MSERRLIDMSVDPVAVLEIIGNQTVDDFDLWKESQQITVVFRSKSWKITGRVIEGLLCGV